MSNLTIENLGRYAQVGDAESLVKGPSIEQAGATFSEILKNSVEQVNDMQTQANQAIHELVAGRNKNIHETLLTIERADDSLKLMMQVRNKILDAYREIMRMQV